VIEIDSMVWATPDEFNSTELCRLQMALTIYPKGFGKDRPEPIELLKEDRSSGQLMYGLPLIFGLKTFQTKYKCKSGYALMQEHVTDCRSGGTPVRFDGCQITPRGDTPQEVEAQRIFFDTMHRQTSVRPAALAMAPTGSGKTVSALYTIAKLGVTTIVIVPSGRIARQWVKAAKTFLNLPDNEIGYIGGGTKTWQGRKLVVAIIHNLVDGDKMPDEFYTYFGLSVYDEAHVLGARQFGKSMTHLPTRYKLAMSATPYRKDGCGDMFTHQFGKPCIEHTGDAIPTNVRVFDFTWAPDNELDKKPIFVKRKIVMACYRRNVWIASTIYKLYMAGRHVLILSEEIAHLQNLIGRCAAKGVRDRDLGLYCRQYIDSDGKSKKVSDEDLDWVERNSRLIFSTPTMAKDGIDIVRLDAGIDAYPRTEAVQAVGRIRRPLDGKPVPLWITIRDVGIHSLERSCSSRIRDYKKCNCKILESGACKG